MSLQDEYPWQAAPTPTLSERITAATDQKVQQSQRLAGPLRDAMLSWGKAVLTRQALWLAESGLPPDGPLRNPAWGVEVELAHRLAQGDSLQSLQGLWELLPGIEDGAQEAGWYVKIQPFTPSSALNFVNDTLPPLLVAQAINREPALASRILPKLQAQQSWAEVSWGLTELGHQPSAWLTAVQDFDDDHAAEAPARIAWACAALGAWPATLQVDDAFIRAHASCTAALMWLAPAVEKDFFRNPENRDRPPEQQSPWLLSRQTFLRSILHLAQASRWLEPAAWMEWAKQARSKLPSPLVRLVKALGINLRLNAAEQGAVVAMCCPKAAVAFDWMDDECWQELTALQCRLWHYQHGANDDGTTYNMDIFGPWLDCCLFPAIWSSDSSKYYDSLLVPPNVHTRPLLLVSPARLPEWLFLYKRELPRLSTSSAAQAWVTLALFARWSIASSSGQQAIEEARDALINSKGEEGWLTARSLLKEQLRMEQLTITPGKSQERHQVGHQLLHYLNLTSEEWTAAVAKMQVLGRQMGVLLAAGAPAAELAKLLVDRATKIPQLDHDLIANVKDLLKESPQSLFQAGLFTSPQHLKVLAPQTWPNGPWLNSVTSMAAQGEVQAWTQLIQHLATFSEDSTVRSVCLKVLLQMEDRRAAD